MFKKLFALLIMVSMVLTMTYIPAVAEDFAYSDILPDGWMEVEADACRIGEKTYKTLADAIGAAEDGDVISLLRDVEEEGPFEIIGGSVTVDGNGYTINCANGFEVSDGSLTLSAGLTVVASESAALYVICGEAVTFANLKSTGGAPAIAIGDELTEGAVTINGGNIEAGEDVSCITCTDESSLAIIGGTFSSNPGDEYCQDGYHFEKNADGMFEMKPLFLATDEEGKTYTDLQTAINEVSANGGKLTLAKNVLDQGVINILPGATLDLNGYTLETEYITVYSGAFIIDSQTGDNKGMLVCDKDRVIIDTEVAVADESKQSNNQVPVWTTENGVSGYVFLNYQFKDVKHYTKDNCLVYEFSFYTQAGAKHFASATSCGVSVMVQLTWVNANGDLCVENVIYSDSQVQAVTGTGSGSYILSISDYEGFSDMSFSAVVVSETGMTTAPSFAN